MPGDKNNLYIAMLGHNHMLSREGGIEIVVYNLATRLASCGHKVVCYDRNTSNVADGTVVEQVKEYEGVKIIPVWTIEKKGLAAMTSSLSAGVRAARSSTDVVHIHAEGPAAVCGLVKFISRVHHHQIKLIVTIHGDRQIISRKVYTLGNGGEWPQ